MSIRRLLLLCLSLLMLFSAACAEEQKPEDLESSQAQSTQESSQTTEESTVKKTYNILFIGNSYTYYNDMPTAIFESIAESAGYRVRISSITVGGYSLQQFADPSDEHGAKVAKALDGNKKYDYVILQEQSVRPASSTPEQFYAAVRTLTAKIREIGATPILYSTWGRKTGSETLTIYGWTNESMTWKLANAYRAIGDELSVKVAHAGLAFFDVYTANTEIELYDPDLTHPSYAGSYLAASTLFAAIFEADPTEATFTGVLSQEIALTLREAAKRAVFETPEIPKQ